MTDALRIDGWLVAEAEARRSGSSRYWHEGRLFLFRSATAWTLLSVRHTTTYGETGSPESGATSAYLWSGPDLASVRIYLERDYGGQEEWHDLVEAGSKEDRELRDLWIPVEIDHDLSKSSVHERRLGYGGSLRRSEGWEETALGMAAMRLEELGFAILDTQRDMARIFGRRLDWGGNAVAGALTLARYGYRADVGVAVDGFGEVYTRTPDSTLDPGADRRFPPRPLTEAEQRQAEAVFRRRREEQLREMEGQGDGDR